MVNLLNTCWFWQQQTKPSAVPCCAAAASHAGLYYDINSVARSRPMALRADTFPPVQRMRSFLDIGR
jgi:hypothetical protein